MKICCGTDIIEIERIKQSIEDEKTGQAFIDQHYAARFAAKEATFKAISDQIKDKYSITWKDIEISNNLQGRPKLNLIGIELKDVENIDLSISHCKEYAVANVTLLKK